MPSSRSSRLIGGAIVAVLIVAGCMSDPVVTAKPSTSVAPSQVIAGSAPPASVAIAPTPSPTPDPLTALQIGAPFVLSTNQVNRSLTQSMAFEFDVAGRHIRSTMTGREIRQNGALAGLALVMTFDRLTVTRDVFNAAAHGAADSSGGKVAFSTILGQWAAIVTSKDSTFGMYALHDEIVLVGGPTGTDVPTLLTAVIKANQ